jgi:4-diphosphocytidyl-2-C-methyl-D-erythritol kinase
MNEIKVLAPAKINLCLSVLGRRPDGYHDVEMLMQMVGLYDEVRVRLGGPGISVACDAGAVPSGEGNIAWKAAAAMLARSPRRDAGLHIDIKKNIPVAAGLGGGSSNAAAVLTAANMLLETRIGHEELARIGTGIGMDVPFFFYGPLALATGRGETVTKLAPLPKFPVLLVNPGFATSTAWVYKNLNLRLTKKMDCNKIGRFTVRKIAQNLHNDLETCTAAEYPVIQKIEDALIAHGALGACMSGSGPTVFGIFEDEQACREAAGSLSEQKWKVFPVEALTASPIEVYHTI